MNRLRAALESDRFELHYQPLMHIKTRDVSHYETLLRLPTDDGVARARRRSCPRHFASASWPTSTAGC